MYNNKNKLNKIKYHTVGTFQNPIPKIAERGKINSPKTHAYMTANFPGLVQALQ